MGKLNFSKQFAVCGNSHVIVSLILCVPDPRLWCHGVHGVPSPDTLQSTELLIPERRVKSEVKKVVFLTNFEFQDTLQSTGIFLPEGGSNLKFHKKFFANFVHFAEFFLLQIFCQNQHYPMVSSKMHILCTVKVRI
jgi:hypothetical protein